MKHQNSFYTLVLAILICPLLLCQVVQADDSKGSIEATVINKGTGLPVAGATVSLSGAKSSTAKSSESGDFKIDEVPAGKDYSITVSAPGYVTENYKGLIVVGGSVLDLGKLGLTPED